MLASAAPADASWMIAPNGWRSKDFAILKHDGLYHIFWTRQNKGSGPSAMSFGHAVSPDLYIWTQLDTVLTVRPESWDNQFVWAPHVIQRDSVFYMFYTGVTSDSVHVSHQRIGVATSTDLLNWNRLDQPVWSCSQVPWTFCDSLDASGGNFRDPFLMPDPHNPGGWLLYYTAPPYPSDDVTRMVLGMAGSSGDFTSWSDLGPLWATYYSNTGFETVESAHLHEHEGLWYVFYTSNGSQGIVWATSPDPTGPLEAWTYRGRLTTMLGVATIGWFASEILVDGMHQYFCFINSDRVDIREMTWNRSGAFGLSAPSLYHVKHVQWSAASVDSGAPVDLQIEATGWFGQSAAIEVVEVDSAGVETPVPPDSIGLPAAIPLTGPTTTYTWTARTWPDEDGAPGPELIVRMQDHTATSGPLHVVPPDPPPPPPPPDDPPPSPPLPPGDPSPSGDDGQRPGDHYDWDFAIRALDGTPLGKGPAVLVQMASAGFARVDLFDVRGRRIRNLAARELGRGANVLPWDGRTEIGGPAGPGVYFVRVAAQGATRWTRVVLRR